jgi:hypothetical protein
MLFHEQANWAQVGDSHHGGAGIAIQPLPPPILALLTRPGKLRKAV